MRVEALRKDLRAAYHGWQTASREADRLREMLARKEGDELDVCSRLYAAIAEARVLWVKVTNINFTIMVSVSYRQYKRLSGITGGPWL